jgi:hypothetical protein
MIPGPYVTADPEFNTSAYQDFEERLSYFYAAFSTSDAMFLAMPGKGSQYAGAFYDAEGDWPSVSAATRCTCPLACPPPATGPWVVHEGPTRCLLNNEDGFASIASNQNLTLNDDGSAELHFGPQPPPLALATGSKPSSDAVGSGHCASTDPRRHSSTALDTR